MSQLVIALCYFLVAIVIVFILFWILGMIIPIDQRAKGIVYLLLFIIFVLYIVKHHLIFA